MHHSVRSAIPMQCRSLSPLALCILSALVVWHAIQASSDSLVVNRSTSSEQSDLDNYTIVPDNIIGTRSSLTFRTTTETSSSTTTTTSKSMAEPLTQSVPEKPSRKRSDHPLPDQMLVSPGRAETKLITNWKPTDSRVLYIDDLLNHRVGAVFYDARIYNYSQFVMLPKQSTIYVIENKVTLLKLDMTTFFLLDSYTIPTPQKRIPSCQDSWACHQAKEISLLAVMPNEQMIWFCYVHYYQYVNRPAQYAESGCMVPQPGNLAEPVVQWENPHFNSLDPNQLASVLNANDGFTYISAFAPDYLRIFRAHMPDWNGRVNWTGALVTDKSRIYISEPAQILLTFETANEVYFVLREQQTDSERWQQQQQQQQQRRRRRRRRGTTSSGFDGTVSDVARLIRVCKGDRGGLPHVNAEIFGTFAKADLHCAAADDDSGGFFTYTHIQAVFWENVTERLYISFGTEKWAPTGSALCVYSKQDIEDAFSGPLLQPAIPGVSQTPIPFPNSFPNICERFNSNNLTSEEVAIGRRISLTFPSRKNPIEPMYRRALVAQTGVAWIHLQAYNLPALPTHYHFGNPAHTTIVWLGTKQNLIKLAVYEAPSAVMPTTLSGETESDAQPVVCKLNELLVGRSLDLLSRPQAVPEVIGSTVAAERRQYKRAGSLQLGYLQQAAARSKRSLRRETEEEIRQIGVYFPRIFIITDRQLLWLPLTDCSVYKSFDDCIQSKDPHCGWSWPEARCANGYDVQPTLSTTWFNTYSPSIDRRRPENAQCPEMDRPVVAGQTGAWSTWYTCRWLNGDEPQYETMDPNVPVKRYSRSYGSCRCRVCLSQTDCVLGTQEVINCTRHERNWLEWSTWSPCDISTNVQTRQRDCLPGTVCIGSSREQRLCSPSSIWSNHFRALTAPSPMYAKPGPLPQKGVNYLSQPTREGFTGTHLILVAICSILFGSLLTGLIFCILWHPCCILPDPGTGCCTPGRRHHASMQPSLAGTQRYQSDMRGGPGGTVDDAWSIPDTSEPTWPDQKADDHGNNQNSNNNNNTNNHTPWTKCQRSSALYETLLDPTRNSSDKARTRATTKREHRPRRIRTRWGSSLLQLLTGSPLPSPTASTGV